MDTLYLYGAIFISALFALGAVLGFYLVRTESREGPPVDPGTLLEAIDEAAVVLDADDTVVMANVAFRSLFDADPADRRLADVLADSPDVLAAATRETDSTVSLGTGERERHFEVHTHPLGDGIDEDRGRLVLVRDVTGRESRERALERQNERLEEFASVISHDLRNPLDVAIGRTTAASEDATDPDVETHLEVAQDAHRRMRRIVADVLALARNGGDVDELSDVSLERVADSAWNHVETGTASLAVETDVTVRADEKALVRVLENLFRNAIEHGTAGTSTESTPEGSDDASRAGPGTGGSEAITVRVGDHDDGFFVADDGTGMPADQHETAFEAGHTGDGHGTGLGLAIVARIAEAHDWAVSLADSEAGGARIEFSSVELVADDTVEPDQS